MEQRKPKEYVQYVRTQGMNPIIQHKMEQMTGMKCEMDTAQGIETFRVEFQKQVRI